jgi:hypothetical protein
VSHLGRNRTGAGVFRLRQATALDVEQQTTLLVAEASKLGRQRVESRTQLPRTAPGLQVGARRGPECGQVATHEVQAWIALDR